MEVKLNYSCQQSNKVFYTHAISHANLALMVQTLTSAGSQACVETEVNAGILRAVLTAAASWDTESTTEQSPSAPPETKPPAKVKLAGKR